MLEVLFQEGSRNRRNVILEAILSQPGGKVRQLQADYPPPPLALWRIYNFLQIRRKFSRSMISRNTEIELNSGLNFNPGLGINLPALNNWSQEHKNFCVIRVFSRNPQCNLRCVCVEGYGC